MFSFSKRPPDTFRLVLGYSHAQTGTQQELEVSWTAGDETAAVLAAVAAVRDAPDLLHEHVVVQLTTSPSGHGPGRVLGQVAAAAGFGPPCRLALTVQATRAQLVSLELSRSGAGGSTLPADTALALWSALDVSHVTRLRVADGGAVAALGEAAVLARFTSLRVLNLSNAGLATLPAGIGTLSSLRELRVVGNQLKILPPMIGKLAQLRVLAADSNQLTILPGELRHCELLEELTLQHNRLTSVLLSFSSLRQLSVLHLYDNPLEFLPEISPCARLRHLTVANLRVTSDHGYTKFKAEVLAPPPSSGGGGLTASISLWDSSKQAADKLRPIFALMLRRSSGHHPLLAGALRVLAEEDPKNREVMARQENGLQQLVLMALSDNPLVVEETCRTLALLAEHTPALAEAVVDNDAAALMRLLPTADERRQLSILHLLSAIAASSSAASTKVATDSTMRSLQQLVLGGAGGSGGAGTSGEGACEEVVVAALKALGNLAFCADNRRRLERHTTQLMQRLSHLAVDAERPLRVQVAALRLLAVLGENELVRKAVGRAPISSRGLRILSLDGGGMKGMATVQLLKQLELHTGRRVYELFDLIVGTSTGGLLAVALGLRRMTLDECTFIYKVLGQKVFSRVVAGKEGKDETWMESFYRTFQHKTSHVRAVVVGYKHDASVYEGLLRDYCDFSQNERCVGNAMIDTACIDVPKVALVSTLSSVSPAPPFVFRNYNLPPASEALARQIGAHAGSCKHPVWQAVRASSAASFFLEPFSCGGDKFQDGAVVANNPGMIAVQEARLLWPDQPIDVVVSLGVGSAPVVKREVGLSAFMETGAILIESSTDVHRAQEALATLLPLVPGVKYFRFAASDQRCAMELDEVDPERWAALEAATAEYIATPAVQQQFVEAAAALIQGGGGPVEAAQLRLGTTRRKLAVLRAPRLAGQQASVDDAVAASLTGLPGLVASINLQRLSLQQRQAGQQQPQQQLQEEQPSTPPAPDGALPRAMSAPGGSAKASPRQAPQPASGTQSPQQQQQQKQEQQQQSDTEQSGGLTGFLSSWFSSRQVRAESLEAPALAGASAAAGLAAGTGLAVPRLTPRLLQAAAGGLSGGVGVGTGENEAAATSELLSQLESQLAPLLAQVGALHLGCAAAPGGDGLVLRWRQQLQAVVEPSEQASALLAEAGFGDASDTPAAARGAGLGAAAAAAPSLADLLSQCPTLDLPGGRTLSLVSRQTVMDDGAPLSLLLLSCASPQLVLPPAALPRWLVRGQLVVSASALPPALRQALLRAGARGVVCAGGVGDNHGGDGELQQPQPAGVGDHCAFFGVFYEALGGGASATHALQSAADAQPSLAGVYQLYEEELPAI